MLTVVMKFDANTFSLMHDKGQQEDYTWWLDYAEAMGISFNIRGRRKRRQDPEAKARTVMHITGTEGQTVNFYKQLRKSIGRKRGTMVGLPLPDRCMLRYIGQEEKSAEQVMNEERDQAAAIAEDPAATEEEQEDDAEDEASNPDEEEHMLDPLTRAQMLTSAPVGTEVLTTPPGLDTTSSGAVDTDAEARALLILLAMGALDMLEVDGVPGV